LTPGGGQRRLGRCDGLGDVQLGRRRRQRFFVVVERICQFRQLLDRRVDLRIRRVVRRVDSGRSGFWNSGGKRRRSGNGRRGISGRGRRRSGRGVEALKLPVGRSGGGLRAERSPRTCRGVEVEQSEAVCHRRGRRVVARDGRPLGPFGVGVTVTVGVAVGSVLLLVRVFLNFEGESKFVNFYAEFGVLGLFFHFRREKSGKNRKISAEKNRRLNAARVELDLKQRCSFFQFVALADGSRRLAEYNLPQRKKDCAISARCS